jgi:glycosyltransferase involved in cell wall biosynthesis
MKIAQVAPLYESVPPALYGGTERIVSYLTEELVRQGHDVTLFASADSATQAKLVPCSERALRLDSRVTDPLAHHCLQLEEVFSRANEFDIVHFHIDYFHFPLFRRHAVPHVTTLHGRLDLFDLQGLYKNFCDVPLVSISNAQRQFLPWVNWIGTIHHGLPVDLYQAGTAPGDYLLFLGRVAAEKRLDRAVEIAKRVGMPLKCAAKIEEKERQNFETLRCSAEGFLDWIGEVDDRQKQKLIAGAHALLFPIDWPEPFGVVLIEAMACGTPVIAYRCGSVPELVEEGVTGFIVDNVDAAVEAVAKAGALDRALCRQRFEERFTAARMARQYVSLYQRLIGD